MISTDLRSLLKTSINNGLSGLTVPEPVKLSEWADENFYLSAESSSVTGAWETLPYQKAIMNCISNDDIRTITWEKSARVGYTKIIVAAMGYFAEHKRRNQVIYQPTDDDAENFVKDEIDTAIRDVPILRNVMKTDPEKRSKDNTLSKKVFVGSTLDIRGGKSPRNYRRLTKDVVYYDELDGFDVDISGEGSPIKLGDKRTQTSSFPKSIRGSTPKIRGSSQIDASLKTAGLIFRRGLPCPSCGVVEPLTWANMNYKNRDPSTARMKCEHCDYMIQYSEYSEMDRRGMWVADNGTYIDEDDMFHNSDGVVVDPPSHVGFHIWSAYSYFQTWAQLVESWIEANDLKKIGDLTALKAFINIELGEPFEEEGERADPISLYARREHYDAEVPDGVKVLTAFIDVQDDRFEYEIDGWGEGEECFAIDYKAIYGNLSLKQIWENLAEGLRRSFKRADGTLMNITVAGIDSGGHYTDEVYQFSKKMGVTKVIPTKGSKDYGRPVAVFPKKKDKNGVYLTFIGTDTAKELVYHRYEVTEPGPGCIHHPVSEIFDQVYFKQATAEEKLKKYRLGKPYFYWDAKKRRNEVLDCKVGNLAMIRVLQQNFGLDLNVNFHVGEQRSKPKRRVTKSKYMDK